MQTVIYTRLRITIDHDKEFRSKHEATEYLASQLEGYTNMDTNNIKHEFVDDEVVELNNEIEITE